MNHNFDIELAKRYGVDCAIMIENFRFWINKNECNDRHFYEGQYWTYNSAKALTELFPYWSASQITRIIKKLEDAGILLSRNFNNSSYDRTKWYSLNREIHFTKSSNGNDEIVKSTNIETDINTDINTDSKAKRNASVEKFDVLGYLIDQGVDEQTAKDWIAVRKAKKAAPTKTAIDKIKEAATKGGYQLNAALEICCQRGWAGFDPSWLDKAKTQNLSFAERDELLRRKKYEEMTGRPWPEDNAPQLQTTATWELLK